MTWQLTPTSVATAVGLFMSTGFFAVAAFNTFTIIPALLLAPPGVPTDSKKINQQAVTEPFHLARQWHFIYDHGRRAGPFTAGLGGVSWIYVASVMSNGNTRARNLYLAGGLFSLSVVPFTIIVMRNSVSKLSAQARIAESGKPSTEDKQKPVPSSADSTEALLKEWALQNFLRGLLPIVGMSCVIMANM